MWSDEVFPYSRSSTCSSSHGSMDISMNGCKIEQFSNALLKCSIFHPSKMNLWSRATLPSMDLFWIRLMNPSIAMMLPPMRKSSVTLAIIHITLLSVPRFTRSWLISGSRWCPILVIIHYSIFHSRPPSFYNSIWELGEKPSDSTQGVPFTKWTHINLSLDQPTPNVCSCDVCSSKVKTEESHHW